MSYEVACPFFRSEEIHSLKLASWTKILIAKGDFLEF